jgi:hypothetical protein
MGIPARPVFGLRVDSSRLFTGLGVIGNLRTLPNTAVQNSIRRAMAGFRSIQPMCASRSRTNA